MGIELDLIGDQAPLPIQHVCCRVDDGDFDATLGCIRTEGIAHRRAARGPNDKQVSGARQPMNPPNC